MISAEFQGIEELNKSIHNLISTLGLPYQKVFPQEAKLLAEECMKRCPPFPNGNMEGSNATDARKSGEVTLAGDIERSITPHKLVVGGKTINKWLRKVIRDKDVEKVKKAFRHIPSMSRWDVVKFDKTHHKRVRGKNRYGPIKSQFVMTFDQSAYSGYQKTEKRKPGFMKAGFGIAVQMLRGRVPAWVSRHIGNAPGGIEMDITDSQEKPYIKFWNDAPTIGKYATGFRFAVSERVRSIGVKLNQALERRMGEVFK